MRIIYLLVFLLLIVSVNAVSFGYNNPNLPQISSSSSSSSASGSGGSGNLTQAQADALYWRLDSSNDNNVQADWNRRGKSFLNISAIYLDYLRKNSLSYVNVVDDLLLNNGEYVENGKSIRFSGGSVYPSYKSNIYQLGNYLIVNSSFLNVSDINGNTAHFGDLTALGQVFLGETHITDTMFTEQYVYNENEVVHYDDMSDYYGNSQIGRVVYDSGSDEFHIIRTDDGTGFYMSPLTIYETGSIIPTKDKTYSLGQNGLGFDSIWTSTLTSTNSIETAQLIASGNINTPLILDSTGAKGLTLGSVNATFSDSYLNVRNISIFGNKLLMSNRTNSIMNRCTLVSGACTVANNQIANNTNVFCFEQNQGGTVGSIGVSGRNAGVNYTISSSNVLDTSIIACELIQPNG